MHPETCKPETRRTNPKPGLVIAAIGFQLLLCSLATAAGACSDTIDRSARRLPSHVAQVFKEIADRHAAVLRDHAATDPGFRLGDCDHETAAVATIEPGSPVQRLIDASLLNLPPPAMG